MVASRKSVPVLALAAALAVPGVAAGATLSATLSGAKEVPKAANGSGTAKLTLKPNRGRICFDITLRHVGTAQMGHIHKGKAGVAGPISVALFMSPTKHPKGCVSASKSQINAILRHPSRFYVNVHTQKFPAGAARGQLHH
jgi:CHRD domain